ncbi:24376_t:CDS:1, partial [Racocetra persica]
LYKSKLKNRCSKNYDKAKKKVLEIEECNRDRALNEYKNQIYLKKLHIQ